MKDSLDFTLPRMVKGGLILVHDYPVCAGVKKAVDSFELNKTIKGTFGRQLLIEI